MRVLYIEDDLIDQRLFKRLVKRQRSAQISNYAIVSSLAEAITILKQQSFDLVISDCYIGKDTIYDVINLISQLPIVAVSGIHDPNLIQGIQAKGVQQHLVKPLCADSLSQIVQASPSPTTTSQQAASNSTLVDFTHLQKLTKDNWSLELEFLAIFEKVVEPALKNIQKDRGEQAWQEISFNLHRIKSNMRLVGMTQAVQVANQLELYYKDVPTPSLLTEQSLHLDALLTQLKEALSIVSTRIQQIRTQKMATA